MMEIAMNGNISDNKYLNISAIRNGDLVLTYPYNTLQTIKHYLIANGMEEEEDFHISKEGDTPLAYYTMINDPKLVKNWNKV